MPKYLCLQRPLPGANEPQLSPGEMQSMYARFNEWREQFQNHLTDVGGRLGGARLVGTQAGPDAPLVEVKELVGGYMIVTASDFDEAIRIASACPGLIGPRSGVEVIEIQTP
ncbi:YciI family protein [Piscinibacter sp. HJYY11]|uniref:YciI family protein n=1 Tax=Piscinibacter sp. HJYY11 TaxID=2801333 RepID=UPI00191DE994|nr:YciI family protein [Piscinibacter sp. HJYY11]MBL0726592.1 hypothetical protein [Piscinibacter sp. HJYY11]